VACEDGGRWSLCGFLFYFSFSCGFSLGRYPGRGQGGDLFRRWVGVEAVDRFDGFAEVELGLEAVDFAVLQQGVEDGVLFPGLGTAEEQIVFRAQLGDADGVLNEVGIQLVATVGEDGFDFFPLVTSVGERFAEFTLGKDEGIIRFRDLLVKFP